MAAPRLETVLKWLVALRELRDHPNTGKYEKEAAAARITELESKYPTQAAMAAAPQEFAYSAAADFRSASGSEWDKEATARYFVDSVSVQVGQGIAVPKEQHLRWIILGVSPTLDAWVPKEGRPILITSFVDMLLDRAIKLFELLVNFLGVSADAPALEATWVNAEDFENHGMEPPPLYRNHGDLVRKPYADFIILETQDKLRMLRNERERRLNRRKRLEQGTNPDILAIT